MEETKPIYAALAAAQSEFKTVVKNQTNPAFKSKYADLQAIFDAVRPALNAHGIFLTQKVTTEGTKISIETILLHESGESLSSGVLTVDGAGGQGPKGIQALGSAITYARRYSVSAFLGITADDDDDGNASVEHQTQKPKFYITEEMLNKAKAVAANGVDAYKAYYEKQSEDFRREFAAGGWHNECFKDAHMADVLKEAEAAAAKGLEAYQEYFMTKLNNEERGELTRSGNHDRLKKVAAANHQPTE